MPLRFTRRDGETRFSLSANDTGCGLASIKLNIDGAGWTDYTGGFNFTGYGNHSFEYYSLDNLGNKEKVWRVNVTYTNPQPTNGTLSGHVSYSGGPKDGHHVVGATAVLLLRMVQFNSTSGM